MSRPLATLLIGAVATLVLAAPVLAGNTASDVRREALERREDAQKEAISDGRRDGGITIWEKWRLNNEQRRLDRMERQAFADGKVTKKEYVELREARETAAKHIRAERTDAQVRGWWWRTFSR